MPDKEKRVEFSKITKEAVEKLGYDWEIVNLFKTSHPRLFTVMWREKSPYHVAVMKKEISNDDLREFAGFKPFPPKKLSIKAQIAHIALNLRGIFPDTKEIKEED